MTPGFTHIEPQQSRPVSGRLTKSPVSILYGCAARRFTAGVVSGLLTLSLMSACTQDGYPLENTWHTQGKAPSAAPQPSTYKYRYPDQPPVLDVAGLQEFVGRFRHRVVLLDFWASWSRRNREELQMLARLQDDLEPEGFQVIACNLDGPEKWNTSTVPMLHAAEAGFPCVILPESEKAKLRAWLAPNWSYDLPARFVINRQGVVAAQAFAATPLGEVEQQVRQHVDGKGGRTYTTRLSSTGGALRAKLIHCRTGQAESFPEITADPVSAPRLGEQIAAFLAARIDRATNPRIAILPFGDARTRKSGGVLGEETALAVEGSLKDQGYYDLIPPAQTRTILESQGLSAMSLDYEPNFAKGKLDADYLVFGWLRTAQEGSEELAATPRREPTVTYRQTEEAP